MERAKKRFQEPVDELNGDYQQQQREQNLMLSKYEDFFKVSKSEECSLYVAISREMGHPVLLKRIKNKLTWDEVLKNRNMQLSQKSKAFPKMIEIFKNKGDFYVVYERPSGPSLQNIQQASPLPVDDFYILFSDLTQHLQSLKEHIPNLYVLPEWIFLHRHTIKVVHFEPFFQSKEALSSDHVYLYKVQNQIIPAENEEDSNSSIVPTDKKRNLIFNLGMISYNLLTAHRHPNPQTQDDYLTMVHEISENAEKRVLKSTKDKQLASMVAKMLSGNVFELPEFEKINNFMKTKAAAVAPKKKNYTNSIAIDIQHIKLQQSRKIEEVDFKKKLRSCCAEKQSSIERINAEMRMSRELREHKDPKEYERKTHAASLGKDSVRHAFSSKKSFLPTIHKGTGRRQKTVADLMNTTNSKPMMFNNRSLIF